VTPSRNKNNRIVGNSAAVRQLLNGFIGLCLQISSSGADIQLAAAHSRKETHVKSQIAQLSIASFLELEE
jgi:hypothetical protein